MINGNVTKVEYELYTSKYSIRTKIPNLLKRLQILSFDTEVRSVYGKELRQEAKEYLKEARTYDEHYKQARVVENSSGLSYPKITEVTHFIFGESSSKSHVIVCNDHETEMFIWNTIAKYEGRLIVHNALFDLKIMQQRIGCLPKDFVDTALMVKCIVNHVNIWKAKTGLKELVGIYYDPKWSMMDDYEPENLKNEDFLMYAATDGAGTYLLYELIQEEMKSEENVQG